MDRELKQSKDKYNNLYNEEIANRIKNKVLSTIKDEKKTLSGSQSPIKLKITKSSIGRKVVMISGLAAIIFALVLSIAFVSPSMAKVVSKIPYLGKLFIQKPIMTTLSEELNNKGYKIDSLGVVYQPNKEIAISLAGSKKYYEDVKDEVQETVKNILKKYYYDTYSIKVERKREIIINESKDDQKRIDESERITTAINNELSKHKFNILYTMVRNDKFDRYIGLQIPDTVEKSQIDEMKSVINHAVEMMNVEPFPIKVRKVNLIKQEQDGRWGENLSLIGEIILSKSEYKVKGIGYSVYPKIELFIRTTVKSTDDNANEFGNNLARVIDEFLKSEEMKSKVKDDIYQINILSKDKKKLNIK